MAMAIQHVLFRLLLQLLRDIAIAIASAWGAFHHCLGLLLLPLLLLRVVAFAMAIVRVLAIPNSIQQDLLLLPLLLLRVIAIAIAIA